MPSETSREYLRNYGVADTKAISAWKSGATGKGITVAVVDSGIELDHPDLGSNVLAASTDIISGRNKLIDEDRHGVRVASVIAAPFNDFGTVGIAYNASILSIRADVSDCQKEDQKVCFKSTDLARSIDYAVSNGAKIINMSLGGEGMMGATFEAALLSAINAGVIFAISSGNEAETNPGWPGRYASDPRFAGGIIVVGSHNQAQGMSDFTNRAGVSQFWFLSAPGEKVVVDCKDTSCWAVSGTSFASPAVAGAMALLLEAFPNLTGKQVVDILLKTARDAGDEGTDIVWGRGMMDIAAAFQPVGTTSMPQANGGEVILNNDGDSYIGGPFGDAMGRASALATIAFDDYDRMFTIQMNQAYRTAPRRSYQPENPTPMRHSEVSMMGLGGTRLYLAASKPIEMPEAIVSRLTPYNAPWLGDEPRSAALFDINAGRLSLTAWTGQGGSASPFHTDAGDGFAALAQADRAVRGQIQMGAFNLTAETGTGDRRMPLRQVEEDASNYQRAHLNWTGQGKGLSFSMGHLEERMGPLGAYMPTSSDLAMPSSTSFGAVGGHLKLGRSLMFSGEFGMGRTDIREGFMRLADGAISSNWRLALQSNCPSFIPGCDTLVWQIAQPLRIESGEFSAVLADVPLSYFDPITFSERRFSAAPSGRQMDFSLRSLHRLPGGSRIQLEAIATRNEQHRADASTAYAIISSWRRGF